jgi:ATP-dependent Clp protease protease subunit|tara:strand:+ start:173 stop:874 length:702 start_codon:yes stop_codon:yes gene_type:complete
MLDFYSEFKKYAHLHMGIDEMKFRDWDNLQTNMYNNVQVSGSLTPYILEEREMRVTQMDIFSRLMMDRILWVAGPVNDQMSTVIQAQLMFLDNLEPGKMITMHVDSPGGSVKSGLSMVDVMNYVSSDIQTINTGMAASMGSILLGAGTKGMRYSLPSSKVMLHQVSSGAQGHVEDMRISINEAEKYNQKLFGMLAEYCGKELSEVLADCNRDNWLTADEAKDYGIIDGVVVNK